MTNKKGELRLRVLTITTATLMLATGFKLMSVQKEKKDLLEEQNELLKEYEETLIKYDQINNTLTTNDVLYNVDDIQVIGGRTIYFVSDVEEEPVEEIVEPNEYDYVDITSDEYIMQEDGVLHDPDLDLEFNNTNEMIAFYSKVFQLNDELVAEKVYEFIQNNPTGWEYSNVLNGENYDSQEQAIALTLLDISLFPEDYGYEEEDIRVEEYELEEYIPEELIYKFSEVLGVNPNIALAIAYGESGRDLDSYNFTHNYNVAGLHRRTGDPSPQTSEGYIIFQNPADGLFRFVTILHDYFYVTEDSGIDRINAMSNSYCAVPAHWRNLVGGIYYELVNNGYDSIYKDHNPDGRDLIYPEEGYQYTI